MMYSICVSNFVFPSYEMQCNTGFVCLYITGQVTDLKGHCVTQVAMGKAHTCVLTKNGDVWTFGVNNKGQCGRDTGAMSQAGKGNDFCV